MARAVATKKGEETARSGKARRNLRWVANQGHSALLKNILFSKDFATDTRDLDVSEVGAAAYLYRNRRNFADALRAYRADNSGSEHEKKIRKSAANQILAAFTSGHDSEDYAAAEAALDAIVQSTTRTFPTNAQLEDRARQKIARTTWLRESFAETGERTKTGALKSESFEFLKRSCLSDEEKETSSVMWELLEIVKPALLAFANPGKFFTVEVYKYDKDFPRADGDCTIGLPALDMSAVPIKYADDAEGAWCTRWAGRAFSIHDLARTVWAWGVGALSNPTINAFFHVIEPRLQSRLIALAEMRDSFGPGRAKGKRDAANSGRKQESKRRGAELRKRIDEVAMELAAGELPALDPDAPADRRRLRRHVVDCPRIGASAKRIIAAEMDVTENAIRQRLRRSRV
jgi:hypothetical protein